jgi:hypothetical protein
MHSPGPVNVSIDSLYFNRDNNLSRWHLATGRSYLTNYMRDDGARLCYFSRCSVLRPREAADWSRCRIDHRVFRPKSSGRSHSTTRLGLFDHCTRLYPLIYPHPSVVHETTSTRVGIAFLFLPDCTCTTSLQTLLEAVYRADGPFPTHAVPI